jgi:hypothetical protein
MRTLRLRRYAWRIWDDLPGDVADRLAPAHIWTGLCEGWSLSQIAAEFL